MQQDDLIVTRSTKQLKEEELARLRTVELPKVREAVKKAREYGDLSENFEYHAARQAHAILNGQIAELEALLERATVVEDAPTGGDEVALHSIVAVRDCDSEEDFEYTIVDAASADPLNDRISYSSPLGQALLDHKIGDVVDVPLPAGMAHYEITGLRHA